MALDIKDKSKNTGDFCPMLSSTEKLFPCREDCMLFSHNNSMCTLALSSFALEDIATVLSKALRVELE